MKVPTAAPAASAAPTATAEPAVRRPFETAIAEGNLLEYPLFALSKKTSSKKRAESLTREIDLGEDATIDGEKIRRRIRIIATQEYGFPTSYAEQVLFALFDLAQKRFGRPDPVSNPWAPSQRVLPVSRLAIANALGNTRPSKTDYSFLRQACLALKATTYEFHATWWDKTSGRHRNLLRAVALLNEVQFYDERERGQLSLELDGGAAGQPRSFVEFGGLLFESLASGYCVGIDNSYLNALRSHPLARRVYGYLTKKDAPRTAEQKDAVVYREGLFKFAKKLGLAKTARSALKPGLDHAFKLLAGELEVDGQRRRFIDRWEYSDDDIVTVHFYRDAFDREAAAAARRQRAGEAARQTINKFIAGSAGSTKS
jgi:hypothetical protein